MISQRDLLRAILELSDTGISVLDRNGKIVFLSPAFQRLTGRSFEEERKRSPTEFVHPSEGEWAGEQIRRALAGEDIGTITCRVK